jgi:hypothetical protein
MDEMSKAVGALLMVLAGLYIMTRRLFWVIVIPLGILVLGQMFPDDPAVRFLVGLLRSLLPLLLVIGFVVLVVRLVRPSRGR